MHYDSQQWTVTRLNHLFTVESTSGTGPADVWALGASIQHFDGQNWPIVDAGDAGPLYRLWVRGPGDVWAVGQDAVVLHHLKSVPGNPHEPAL